jgi:hypothetical protein
MSPKALSVSESPRPMTTTRRAGLPTRTGPRVRTCFCPARALVAPITSRYSRLRSRRTSLYDRQSGPARTLTRMQPEIENAKGVRFRMHEFGDRVLSRRGNLIRSRSGSFPRASHLLTALSTVAGRSVDQAAAKIVRMPAGEANIGRLFSSLDTRTWPCAGC